MVGRSAAYVISIVAVVSFFMGAFILTATDPFMQQLFGSMLWSSDTSWGSDALGWYEALWGFVGMAILITILMTVWINTRQPQ